MLSTLIKHAKHFTDTSRQEITNRIHFYEDGRVFMTDGRVAVLARGVNQTNKNYTTDIKGRHTKDKPYQDYNRLFPSNHECSFEVNVKELLHATSTFEKMAKIVHDEYKGEPVSNIYAFDLSVIENRILSEYTFLTNTGRFEIGRADVKELEVTMNCSYVAKTCKLLKDLKIETCTVLFNGSLRPVVFADPLGSIEILVLPIRRY